jgi:hypothetical protein
MNTENCKERHGNGEKLAEMIFFVSSYINAKRVSLIQERYKAEDEIRYKTIIKALVYQNRRFPQFFACLLHYFNFEVISSHIPTPFFVFFFSH